MTQERAQEVVESIWGDLGAVRIMPPRVGVPSYWVGWQVGEKGPYSFWHGDSWADAFDVMKRCVSDERWPDPCHPDLDQATYILQQLEFAKI